MEHVHQPEPCFDVGDGEAPISPAKLRIGNVEIMALLDTSVLCDPKSFLPRFADKLVEHHEDPLDDLPLIRQRLTCFLVRSKGKTLLIDTGIGNRGREGQAMGRLEERLRQAGVAPGEIDQVINTHMHADHVGWNTIDDQRGQPSAFFPKARYLFQQAEWDYWIRPSKMAQPGNEHLNDCVVVLAGADRVNFVNENDTITSELNFVTTPGHTPGHVAIGIYSGGEKALMMGDVSHYPAQLDHPDWSPIWDEDPVQSARTRDRVFEELAADNRVFLAGHWPYPGFGRIVRVKNRRVFEAL